VLRRYHRKDVACVAHRKYVHLSEMHLKYQMNMSSGAGTTLIGGVISVDVLLHFLFGNLSYAKARGNLGGVVRAGHLYICCICLIIIIQPESSSAIMKLK
jgi:hypothetical protein